MEIVDCTLAVFVLIIAILLLALLAGTVSAAGAGQSPYAIKVNRAANAGWK